MNKQTKSNKTGPNANDQTCNSFNKQQENSLDYKYTKDWDNESIIEHSLTHHSTDIKRRSIGNVDYQSPSKSMIEKESLFQNDARAIWEDAQDCAHKLNLLLITQKASLPTTGIHRANACASHRIASAIRFYCHGETLETIGERMEKKKQVIGRYYKRFKDWSAESCEDLVGTYFPETVIEICQHKTNQNYPLSDALDKFRQQLTDLFHELLHAAEQQETEVYLEESHFKKYSTHPVDVYELLTTH